MSSRPLWQRRQQQPSCTHQSAPSCMAMANRVDSRTRQRKLRLDAGGTVQCHLVQLQLRWVAERCVLLRRRRQQQANSPWAG